MTAAAEDQAELERVLLELLRNPVGQPVVLRYLFQNLPRMQLRCAHHTRTFIYSCSYS